MNVRGSLSETEIATLLESTAVPVRITCHTPSDRLWMLSLWFRYRDGRLLCSTSANAAVVEYLTFDPALAFEVSTNEPPYKGVRGSGSAPIEADPEKELL